MKSFRVFLIFLFLTFLLCPPFNGFAQRGGHGKFVRQPRAPERTGQSPMPSGLAPVFPDGVQCIGISSPFGSRTRYDGSLRPENRYGGRHGGIDLTLSEGTLLLAIAGGTVLSMGKGNQMEGIYLWLRHSPEDTGLPYWVYSKYQHLLSLPELQEGEKVMVGQAVALSGKTGTVGGYYGANGYPHLHLSTLKSTIGDLKIKGGDKLPPSLELIDPIVFYYEATIGGKKPWDPHSPQEEVVIPCITQEGRLIPENTIVVWPVACN